VFLGRLRISAKLAVLAAIPLLAVFLLTIPLVVDRVSTAAKSGDTATRVRVAGALGGVVRDLQEERLLSVGYLVGQVDRADLLLKSAEVDDDLLDAREDLGDDIPPRVSKQLDKLDQIAGLRALVLARKIRGDALIIQQEAIINGIFDALRLPDVADSTTSVGRQVLALDSIFRGDEYNAIIPATIALLIASRSPKDAQTYGGLLVGQLALAHDFTEQFKLQATPEQLKLQTIIENAGKARSTSGFGTEHQDAAAIATLSGENIRGLFAQILSYNGIGRFVETRLVAEVNAAAKREQREALAAAYGVSAAALTLLILVLALTVAVARGVARPLIRLTASAERVAVAAESELVRVADDDAEVIEPIALDPIDVRGRDEVGDLARAFDRVRDTAVRLVERQVAGRRNVATMFGHIGRRTQNLVGRQLALIDRLEREEADPERLHNLYQLDHVSSRLNRNAGSLVVLSGSSAASEQSAPQPVGTVVRLALGEIEDYTRVELDVPEHIVVQPSAVTDLTLVLAELMENATAYSPPHTRVTVTAEATRTGAQVLIVDRGIGMSFENMAEHNARLTRRERLDLAPTEVLGLFVTGRLARRHGFGVTLAPTPGGGVTAVVTLSHQHLVAPAAVSSTSERSTNGNGNGYAPTRHLNGVLAMGLPSFDMAALDRATEAIAAGQWDAFQTRAPALESVSGAGPSTASWPPPGPSTSWWEPPAPPNGSPALRPVRPPELPPVPAVRVPALPIDPEPAERVAAPPAQRSPRREADPAPRSGRPKGLQRRVPGAQLPPGAAARHSGQRFGPPPAPADPAAARALVEAFETGVQKAQDDLVADPVLAPISPGPAPGRPSGRPSGPGLARRVPGAALGDLGQSEPGTLRTHSEGPEAAADRTHEGRAR
jgi:signal transduction histidine kinase